MFVVGLGHTKESDKKEKRIRAWKFWVPSFLNPPLGSLWLKQESVSVVSTTNPMSFCSLSSFSSFTSFLMVFFLPCKYWKGQPMSTRGIAYAVSHRYMKVKQSCSESHRPQLPTQQDCPSWSQMPSSPPHSKLTQVFSYFATPIAGHF